MKVEETTLPGVLLIRPTIYEDARGFFVETWNKARWEHAHLPMTFVQDNLSRSGERVLRGLHLQNPSPQGKLVYALEGEVYDVAVDVRVGSPTFGRWVGVTLSSENHQQIYIAAGLAHGFCALSSAASVVYKTTDFHNPQGELTIAWDDPDIGIKWPVESPILSEKDKAGLRLADVAPDRLPRWEETK